MKRTSLLALMCALLSAPIAAQTQGVITGTVRDCTGVISGSVTSQIGRPLAGITMQLLDSSGSIVGKATTAPNGEFSIQGVACGTDTLQCLGRDNKILGTSSVTLSGPSQSVKMICTTDVVPFWKTKPGGFLLGAGAAAAAIGAAAIISTHGDASGAR
jgi:carboxypeptidase family protein